MSNEMSDRDQNLEGTTREHLHATDSKVTDEVVNAYLETLLWSETLNATDEDGEPGSITMPDGTEHEDGTALDNIIDSSDLPDLAPDVVEEAREDLAAFERYCVETIGINPFRFFDPRQVAHDFCLSRNGHGAGFFDDPYEVEARGPNASVIKLDLSDELQDAAETFGTLGLDLWVKGEGEDAVVVVQSHG